MCPYCFQKVESIQAHLAECPALDESQIPINLTASSPAPRPARGNRRRQAHRFKYERPHDNQQEPRREP